MTIEEREAALNSWKAWKSEKTKAFKEGTEPTPKMDEKAFKAMMSTATVRLSHMRTIATAITSGMDRDALAHHYHLDDPMETEGLSIDAIYQHAKHYGPAKNGRTADTFLVSLGKFLKKRADLGLEGTDLEHYNAVVTLVNTLSDKPAA